MVSTYICTDTVLLLVWFMYQEYYLFGEMYIRAWFTVTGLPKK